MIDVRAEIERLKVIVPTRQQRHPDRDRRIVALYAAGDSLKEIAVHMDMSLETVRQILLRNGVKLRPVGKTNGKRYRRY